MDYQEVTQRAIARGALNDRVKELIAEGLGLHIAATLIDDDQPSSDVGSNWTPGHARDRESDRRELRRLHHRRRHLRFRFDQRHRRLHRTGASAVSARRGAALEPGEIARRLPTGSFLLLDRVDDLEVGISGVGTKNVSISDPVFAGHFPDNPIYPGVIWSRVAAQLCGLIGSSDEQGPVLGYLASIKRFKFLALVVPGDQMKITARAGASIGALDREFAVEITVAGRVVASGVLAIAGRGLRAPVTAEIRELTAQDDLDRVAEFFARNAYGPPGGALTGASLGGVFRERGVRLFWSRRSAARSSRPSVTRRCRDVGWPAGSALRGDVRDRAEPSDGHAGGAPFHRFLRPIGRLRSPGSACRGRPGEHPRVSSLRPCGVQSPRRDDPG